MAGQWELQCGARRITTGESKVTLGGNDSSAILRVISLGFGCVGNPTGEYIKAQYSVTVSVRVPALARGETESDGGKLAEA
jgi:hypothetical protein